MTIVAPPQAYVIASRPLIVGFGNPTVDVTVETNLDDLARLDAPLPGEDAAGRTDSSKEELVSRALGGNIGRIVAQTPGGSALNAMRVAARAPHDTVRVSFIGAVGTDEGAAMIRDAMARDGVVPLLLSVPGRPTGTCVSLVVPFCGDRSLVAVRGAAGEISPEFLDRPEVAEAVAGAAVLYVTSFVLSTPSRAMIAERLAAAAAASCGRTIFSLNLSSVGLMQKVGDIVLGMCARTQWLFGNADELVAFAQEVGATTEGEGTMTDVADIAAMVVGFLPVGGHVIVTSGKDPTFVAEKAQDGTAAQTVAFPVPYFPPGEVKDTNGCGDAFVGGFLCLATVGAPLEACVGEGHRCAAAVLRQQGCDLIGFDLAYHP